MFGRPSPAGPQRYVRTEPEALPHLGPVYSAALSLAGDPSKAEDLVVEAFARAYAACGLREPDAGLRLRLYRSLASARREQQEASRTAGGGAAGRAPGRGEPAAPGWVDPAQAAEAAPMPPCRRARRAMSELPEDLRFTVHLADVEGLSCQQQESLSA